MHICFLHDSYPPDMLRGAGIFTQVLGRALVRRGHRVTVVGICRIRRARTDTDDGVTVVRLPRPRLPQGPRFLASAMQVRRALRAVHRATPIDVLEASSDLRLARAPRDFPAVKIVRLHAAYTPRARPVRARLSRRAMRMADAVCAVSAFAAETGRSSLELGARPIHVQPNPVDTAMFAPRDDVPEVEGLVVFTGSIEEAKGVRRLVRGFARVAEAMPQARLRLVGADTTDRQGVSYSASIRREIAPALAERIAFVGAHAHDALPGMLAPAQVCVFPSNHEAWSLAVMEAMAMGKAVVASATGSGPEVIEHGASGLLCDPFDPDAIADSIVRVLADRALRERLGRQARARVAEHFSIDRIAAQNEAFYERCLQARAPR